MNASPRLSLAECAGQQWDLIVIGGGITGAAVLREAARVGLKCLLLEQRDFAWGASSRSGKWVHGGLRYIKQGQFKVTWHSVQEREKLCRELPGLIQLKAMQWPLFKGKWQASALIHAGLRLYEWMAGTRRRHAADLKQMALDFPYLQAVGLKGAVCFYEGQTDDARLTLRVLQEARQCGAQALNYAEVTQLLKQPHSGAVCGVKVQRQGSAELHEIHARQVIAATGAWADRLRQQVRHNPHEHLRPLRGSHLLFSAERLPIHSTLVLEHPRDRRPGFITLFQGRVMLGNTDIDHRADLQGEAAISPEEVDYLLENIRHHFPALNITRTDVLSSFAGVRPVVDSGQADPSKESREHVLWHEDELISIGGGKLTTFQHIAIAALRLAQHKFPGVSFDPGQPLLATAPPAVVLPAQLDVQQGQQLLGRYGAAVAPMLAQASSASLQQIAGTQTLWCELAWCAAHEDVQHLDDLLLRRTRIGLLLEQGGLSLLANIRTLVQEILGWSDAHWQLEVERYCQLWRTHYSVPDAAVDEASR
ncbi:glycerol-3-phosphate dehydrogenase/oxidase [Pseudomonas sp. 5P_3.1_Bac2]|uniref:glycerol-3-phosphate dehydrogenase/oxidase n=1 Tax=Pseudomonas sp. 5P_3.1_Bac2 TaxID=2971617 RepID=UPI0021CA329E|nr:glycerol-3-phosphate dehydrogenase/oxidase [Pseudomonas sp. 5P_3.1_Bac2]MCU1717379.1 glycerol-3-phosphate dehydrogenase/oxidase [Pseudomonas sp. 5P_3.1_Bac2]